MSAAKENPCRKFQANIFNKSKCQNCFKPRELHLLTDQDLNQAKPIYGGWLCLAPEGTDFDNPMHRSRKWQRRFFVLYEHGCLRFALDESPSTLPQGTVNMNLCTDVIDAEPKTGQKNALCIVTPDQEYYIRGDNKEIINGWSEQLVVYPRTNKQNQKKKRKVEPTTSQEPGPAKVAVTGSGIPEAEKVPDSSSIIWQEELHNREADVSQVWSSTEVAPLGSMLPSAAEEASVTRGSDQGSVNGDEVDRSGFSFPPSVSQPPQDLLSPTGSSSSRYSAELGGIPRCLSPAPSDPFPSGSSLLSNGSHISGSMSSLDSDASGSTVTSTESHPTEPLGRALRGLHDPTYSRRLEGEARKAEKRSRLRSPERQNREPLFSPERSGRSNVIEKLEALELENADRMEVEETARSQTRQGRSEMRRFHRQEQKPDPAQDLDFHHSTMPPLRRAKSLDRRTTESVMTPDLLNFKKGWMVKLDEQGQWKKYWFVLTDHSLRYYKDSIAEEASDLDGEIDLSTCYNVTEYQAQRNYGFQIHTQEGVHTLSAMTAGIRRNWIQAVMKNVRPSTAPDVASLTDDHGSCGPFESLARPDITQDSPSSETSSVEREPKKSRARERRREGRSKTFDWAEFRPIAQALAQQRVHEADTLQAQLADPDRSKRREERRKRYESVTGSSSSDPAADNSKMDFESVNVGLGTVSPPSPERQQKVEEEIEQRWQQVEKTPIREERRVPLSTVLQSRETSELEKLLESYKKGVEDLKAELETCYQQLADSNQHKLDLEDQLKAAVDREQQIRVGYISPLESPLSLETKPQMKRPELVSSQAQSLTKKYQETKELLQLQELKKRNMQAQLGLSLSHLPTKESCFSDTKNTPTSEILPSEPIVKTVIFELLDNEGKIRELEDLIDCSKPLSVKEMIKLLHSHSDSVLSDFSLEKSEDGRAGDITKCQKLLESLKSQQEIENETMRKSLAKAGDNIRNYEARLITMEDMLGRVQRQKMEDLKNPCTSPCQRDDSTQMTNRGLSQRVELLTSENEALNQRYQEIVNQLREADREIDRLKAELQRLQSGHQYQLGRENQEVMEQEDKGVIAFKNFYEQELDDKSLKLQEALEKLEVSENEDDESLLEKEHLRHRIEVLESKLSEKEELLQSANQTCGELQEQNKEKATVDVHSNESRVDGRELMQSDEGRVLDGVEQSRVGEGANYEPANELLRSLASTLSSHVSPQGRCFHEAILDLKEQILELELKLEQISSLQDSNSEDSKLVTHIQIEGEPIDSLDKAIQLQDMVAKHKKELRELREVYEQEAAKLRQEVAKAGETLRLRSEENVKEIDSLTICMENLKDKHEMERNNLVERFNQEMAELSDALGLHGAELSDDAKPNPAYLKQQIQKLVSQVSIMTEEMKIKSQDCSGNAALLRLKYEKDLENLKATCERGFAAMEESHQKVIDELQRKHQRELENLQEEKERLLAEETAATIAAIEAMKNAHRTELEKELDKARKANSNTENADIEEIRRQHEEELLSFQREIEVLSEQYSQKCLENAHLAQALEAERQALRQCQRENQELNAHNQELNNRLAAEITKMRSMTSEDGGEAGTVIQGKELYELEVMLRVKESEVQYLKQEINSLKDELQAAQRDKKYATDKYKDIYTELSIVKAKAERDLGRLRDQLQLAHEALGEPTPEEVQRGGYDIMKSKSNPDILKMAAAAAKRSERAMRSKSLKEGLTAEQRLHLFDNKDTKEF
ncbi:hypothetical protein NFI96_021391 [Prochilodus magdalenae]|nr:hypothetical protein NFI96_021391 [Prochilodus magdalenae]